MKDTKIEWTDTTWNPVVGCRSYSTGCATCYAETMSNRLAGMARADQAKGFNPGRKANYLHVIHDGGWKGNVRLVPEALVDPFGWKTPRLVFVNSMSDLFYGDEADRRACESKGIPFEPVPFSFVDQVCAVMALTPQHTYQVLTKRTARMAEYFASLDTPSGHLRARHCFDGVSWSPPSHVDPPGLALHGAVLRLRRGEPFPNVWLGTSVENQKAADERIPHLLTVPAAVRFLSCEPLLGPVDLLRLPYPGKHHDWLTGEYADPLTKTTTARIDWVIAGGESGPGARPMHPDWARSLRDQCVAANVPFFFKQHGEWCAFKDLSEETLMAVDLERIEYVTLGENSLHRVGKKKAGRLLDGVEHNEMPEVVR